MGTANLRFLGLTRLAVAGVPCDGFMVRTANRMLGQLQGFIVDTNTWRLLHLVIGAPGRSLVMPVGAARVDRGARAIELMGTYNVENAEPFEPSFFPAVEDNDLLATGTRDSAAA